MRCWLIAIAVTAPVLATMGVSYAQQAKMPRIAFVMNVNAPLSPAQFLGFAQGLTDAGYVEPRTLDAFVAALDKYAYVEAKGVTVDFFLATADDELPGAALKAVATKPDILLTVGTPGTQALKDATSTIPILGSTDLLGSGFVASLAHPGGNITGVSTTAPDLSAKKIGILHETAAGPSRVAILNIPTNPAIVRDAEAAIAAARALGLEPIELDFTQTPDLPAQFERVVSAHVQAVYVPVATYFAANQNALCDLFVRNRLPSVAPPTIPCALIAFGFNPTAQYRLVATYVDAILKGAKPGDLPVLQPTVFDFIVNQKTAKALGLTLPQSILIQATQVIE